MSVVQLMPAPRATPVACRWASVLGSHPASCSACMPGSKHSSYSKQILHIQCTLPLRLIASLLLGYKLGTAKARAYLGCCGEGITHELGCAAGVLLDRPRRTLQLVLRHGGNHPGGQLWQAGLVALRAHLRNIGRGSGRTTVARSNESPLPKGQLGQLCRHCQTV